MVPIRLKFDPRYQQVKLVESYDGLFFDDDGYCIVSDSPGVDFGTDNFNIDEIEVTDDIDMDDIQLFDE